ncbi:hypothetical protein LEP1GSC050_0573 [Leptospira broomii serovar Hurstbridge str. 5399]|uniref:Uncharacterized protein n=2 Tax=Leptospira broomii TaxID=301541 RepID=T0F7Y0_9LEPT|nr:hypothetical protein LEP1GSC050_0573 [Leptospira broomii serovar Hurstbridge str. 5399]
MIGSEIVSNRKTIQNQIERNEIFIKLFVSKSETAHSRPTILSEFRLRVFSFVFTNLTNVVTLIGLKFPFGKNKEQ